MTEINNTTTSGAPRPDSINKKYTYKIISMMAYLWGVPKRIFEYEQESPQMSIYEKLNQNKHARIIRNLCILRTCIMRNYKNISDVMKFEFRTILSLPEYVPTEVINQLTMDGVNIYSPKYDLDQQLLEINSQISNRINNCKELFPIWINWLFIKNTFIIPKGLTKAGLKEAMQTYFANKSWYPYKVFINWKPVDVGNILFNDGKFVDLLYSWNHQKFKDYSKVSDASSFVKGGIYDFLTESRRTVVVVDCENSDPYKLSAMLNHLDAQSAAKISKVLLFDDVHTATAWHLLDAYTDLRVEHILIDRIKENKSLVDIRLTADACREFYRNSVDSFILESSDSDYWGLISSIPEAKFLVMMERSKCGPDIKKALVDAEIFYCYIDDFYSGENDQMRMTAVVRELHRYLEENFSLNAKEMLMEALYATRVQMTENEKKQFYNRYIKPMYLEIAEDGKVSIHLRGR